MKRFLITFLILFLSITSCKVRDFGDPSINESQLIDFSIETFSQYVMAPVETMEMLFDFDAYLQLPKEEKEKDTLRFYRNVEQRYDDIYKIIDYVEHQIVCVVKTNGVSLQTEGARWDFESLEVRGSDDLLKNSAHEEYIFPEKLKVVKTGPNEWTMSAGNFSTKMIYDGKDKGQDIWRVTTEGNLNAKNGTYAIFTATGLTIKELPYEIGAPYRGNAYGGNFNMDIYKANNAKLDYCYIQFTPGFATKYVTSRSEKP